MELGNDKSILIAFLRKFKIIIIMLEYNSHNPILLHLGALL